MNFVHPYFTSSTGREKNSGGIISVAIVNALLFFTLKKNSFAGEQCYSEKQLFYEPLNRTNFKHYVSNLYFRDTQISLSEAHCKLSSLLIINLLYYERLHKALSSRFHVPCVGVRP